MKNLKTTVTGIITATCACLTAISILPETLGPAADIIPEQYKTKIIMVSLIAGAVSHTLMAFWSQDASQLGQPPASNAPTPLIPPVGK